MALFPSQRKHPANNASSMTAASFCHLVKKRMDDSFPQLGMGMRFMEKITGPSERFRISMTRVKRRSPLRCLGL
jgi:hypothetical protein